MLNIIKRKDPVINHKRAFSAAAFHLVGFGAWWASALMQPDGWGRAHWAVFILAVVLIDLAGGQARRAGRHPWLVIPAGVAIAGALSMVGAIIYSLSTQGMPAWGYVQMAVLGGMGLLQGMLHFMARVDRETVAR